MDLLFASQEQFLVNSKQLRPYNFEVLFKSLLFQQQFFLLLSHELMQLVQLALLDLSEDSRRNNLELIGDTRTANLKVSYLLEVLGAV